MNEEAPGAAACVAAHDAAQEPPEADQPDSVTAVEQATVASAGALPEASEAAPPGVGRFCGSNFSDQTDFAELDAAGGAQLPQFNFAPATADEGELVFGAARPGFYPGFDKWDPISPADVAAWCGFMRSHGIKRVLSLLSQDEYKAYQGAGYVSELCKSGFDAASIAQVDVNVPGAAGRAMEAIRAAVEASERIVVHCSAGGSRAGTILSLYAWQIGGREPGEAVEAVLASANAAGAVRKTGEDKVRKFFRIGCFCSSPAACVTALSST
mmetsp:Transcript_6406/g.16349  ORF Transcript_6406/g.16349 Transcript_6406/m.16349 type:complete len:269 (-) Transcript_6406:137-943(-)